MILLAVIVVVSCLLIVMQFIPKECKGISTGVYHAKYDSVNVHGIYYMLPNERTCKRMFEIQDRDVIVGEIIDNYFYPIEKV